LCALDLRAARGRDRIDVAVIHSCCSILSIYVTSPPLGAALLAIPCVTAGSCRRCTALLAAEETANVAALEGAHLLLHACLRRFYLSERIRVEVRLSSEQE
jgi:hypothetical protein